MATAKAQTKAPVRKAPAKIVVLHPARRTATPKVVAAPKPPALKAPAKGLAVRASVLQAALARAERITPKKSTLPILGYTLLEWGKGTATLTASNLEMAVVIELAGAVAKGKGAATLLPKAALAALLGADPQTPVTIESIGGTPDKTVEEPAYHPATPGQHVPMRTRIVKPGIKPTVRLVVGAEPYRLGALTPEDFPQPTKGVYARERTIPAGLLTALRQVLPAAAPDDSRPVLSGILWTPKGDVAAADGFRLHVAAAPHAPQALIIPGRFVAQLTRPPGDPAVTVALGHHTAVKDPKVTPPSLLRVRLGTETWYSRLIEGQFPDYVKIIPKEFGWTLTVERAAWLALCDRAKAFQPVSGLLTLGAAKKHISATFKSALDETSEERVEMEWPRVSVRGLESVGLNLVYLRDALARCTTAQVTLAGNGAASPIAFREAGSKIVLAVVMPMQAQHAK